MRYVNVVKPTINDNQIVRPAYKIIDNAFINGWEVFDVVKTQEDGFEKEELIKVKEVFSPYVADTRTYEQKVEDFIAERYTIQQELALINNYNLDNERYRQEYEEYQAYRADCKRRAKN